MDTRTADEAARIEAGLKVIKTQMPQTYKQIQAKAAEIGTTAYALVRRGIAGHANCFYAFERGHVVGTPFNLVEVARDVAQAMVTLGCAHVCIFALVEKEAGNGTH